MKFSTNDMLDYNGDEVNRMKHKKGATDKEYDEVIYNRIVHSLDNDIKPNHNLATYSQTSLDQYSKKIINRTMTMNAINRTTYKTIHQVEKNCVDKIASLWNIHEDYYGVATLGSTEACILAGMSMLLRWEKTKRSNTENKPNLILTSNSHNCWKKISMLADVELIYVPIERDTYGIDCEQVSRHMNEFTIGIVAVLGTTFTGAIDDVEKLNYLVEKYNTENNSLISIHVDAAIGGFYVPFVNPKLCWDFRLKNVNSINSSGHKYGLACNSIGWLIWRNKSYVPKEMITTVDYLGGKIEDCNINFTKSSNALFVQYYRFETLGYDGYVRKHSKIKEIANYVLSEMKLIKELDVITTNIQIPVICWTIKNSNDMKWNLYDLAGVLEKEYGWYLATYKLPDDKNTVLIQRIVCREDFNDSLAKKFLSDFKKAITKLEL